MVLDRQCREGEEVGVARRAGNGVGIAAGAEVEVQPACPDEVLEPRRRAHEAEVGVVDLAAEGVAVG